MNAYWLPLIGYLRDRTVAHYSFPSFAFPPCEAPLFSDGVGSGCAGRRRSGFGLISIVVELLVSRSPADFRSDNRPSTSTVDRFHASHLWDGKRVSKIAPTDNRRFV